MIGVTKKKVFPTKIATYLFFVLVGFWSAYRFPFDPQKPVVTFIGNRIFNYCSHRNPPQYLCYDDELVKLLGPFSLKTVYAITKVIQTKDSTYIRCHTLGHRLGEKAWRLNQSNWVDLIAQCPTTMCSYGCLHGVIGAQYKRSVLTPEQVKRVLPEFAGACNSTQRLRLTPGERDTCVHSIGHMPIFLTGADIPRSVGICRDIARLSGGPHDFEFCISGVFMQVFLPYPDVVDMVKYITPTKEKAQAYCLQFDPDVATVCLRESWGIIAGDLTNASAVEGFCSKFPDREGHGSCVHRLGAELLMVNRMDASKMKPICLNLPHDFIAPCLSGVASSLFTVDKTLIPESTNVCNFTADSSLRAECLDKVLWDAEALLSHGSQDYHMFCARLPMPWKAKCEQR